MNAQSSPDYVEVYFHDGVNLGPMIEMAAVGDELPEIIVGAFAALHDQAITNPTIGQAGAMLTFKAVSSGNAVSLNPGPVRHGLGQQINVLHSREYAPGGIGVVLIDIRAQTVSVYGGRGFDVAPGNPFQQNTFPIELLAQAAASGFTQAEPAAAKAKAKPKKRKGKGKGKSSGEAVVITG